MNKLLWPIAYWQEPHRAGPFWPAHLLRVSLSKASFWWLKMEIGRPYCRLRRITTNDTPPTNLPRNIARLRHIGSSEILKPSSA
ncbi:MAG: hypothetical protein ACYSYV_10145 [Planctomycetota bacterium]